MSAEDIFSFAVTIPHGTLAASPIVSAMPIGVRVVDHIDIRVPPGPRGLMGFRIMTGGQVVIPSNETSWIIADDESMPWDVTGFIDSGAWSLQGYNTGTNDHTVYIRFLTRLPPLPRPAPPSPIAAGQLGGISS